MRYDIDPDEILLDSQNLPDFDMQQFEGRLEAPISKSSVWFLGVACAVAMSFFIYNAFSLQVVKGSEYASRSETNRLRQIPYFAERGAVTDRNGVELAWNDPDRTFIDIPGFSHLVGYVGYPSQDDIDSGTYFPDEMVGRAGAERVYNYILRGTNGVKIVEEDVSGTILSGSVFRASLPGNKVVLSVDADIQSSLYSIIKSFAAERGFEGGAGVMMDVRTGEIIALTSYPEFDQQILSDGSDRQAVADMVTDTRKPFLDRGVPGVYTPGSIVKPFVAIGALAEKVITPEKTIFSAGKIEVPNPYNPGEKTVFKDWKAHGAVDMRHAIAVSSDVYFYEVGGGFEQQKGLGIRAIDTYMKKFGIGEKTGIELDGEAEGTIPSPEWKEKMFDGEKWVLGNTYHTAIGQYGFQVTPLQMVRAFAGMATGKLVQPTILKTEIPKQETPIDLPQEYFKVVREGMRLSAQIGTASGLNTSAVKIAAKTGTAELGIKKLMVNSWVTGFFPYENPHYAFVVVMEKGPVTNTVGATAVMRRLVDWIEVNDPKYFAADTLN